MDLLIALFFGVIQGATEFLPISSGGHHAMIQNFNQTIFGEALFSPTLTFDILLRLGTLLAIIFVFFGEIRMLWREFCLCVREMVHKEFHISTERPYRKLLSMLVITTAFLVPAVFLMEYTTNYLSDLSVIAWMLMLTGVTNFIIDRVDALHKCHAKAEIEIEGSQTESKRNSLLAVLEQSRPEEKEGAYIKKAALVGLFQFCSIIPGLSRCGMTVLGGLFAGFRRDVTVKYAFLAAIPVLVVKILMQTVTVIQDGIQMNWIPYLLGMVAAFISGVVSISVMRKAVRKGYCRRFGIYCILLGITILIIRMRG